MKNSLSPNMVLDFEDEHARSLHWLPWAVRHKLDCAGLSLTLDQWQALPLLERRTLVQLVHEDEFAVHARDAGARTDRRHACGQEIDAIDLASLLNCDLVQARDWLSCASQFARYVAQKRVRLIRAHAT